MVLKYFHNCLTKTFLELERRDSDSLNHLHKFLSSIDVELQPYFDLSLLIALLYSPRLLGKNLSPENFDLRATVDYVGHPELSLKLLFSKRRAYFLCLFLYCVFPGDVA